MAEIDRHRLASFVITDEALAGPHGAELQAFINRTSRNWRPGSVAWIYDPDWCCWRIA